MDVEKAAGVVEEINVIQGNWHSRTIGKVPSGQGLTHRKLPLVKMQIHLKKRKPTLRMLAPEAEDRHSLPPVAT